MFLKSPSTSPRKSCVQGIPCFQECQWLMVWWDQTNASLQIMEQGPASQKISLPSTVCLSLTIRGKVMLPFQLLMHFFFLYSAKSAKYNFGASVLCVTGKESLIRCLERQLVHGPPLPMALALHPLVLCPRGTLKPCQMPKGVHSSGKRRRHLEN